MKRMIACAAVVLLLLPGCSKSPLRGRIWEGELYRSSDGVKLSDVCLKMTSDSLYIYSNAIFGADNEALELVDRNKTEYVFRNIGGERYTMNFDYRKDANEAEILSIDGSDYKMVLSPVEGDAFTPEQLAFYSDKRVAPRGDLYFAGRWMGEIFRIRDNQRLSAVGLEFTGDTMRVYSNAIFGKSNEKLYNVDFENGAFVYMNSVQDEFRLKPEYNGNSISLRGDDFYIDVQPFDGDWEEAISFYRKKDVPRNADSYFFGIYVGKTRGRMPAAALMGALFGIGVEFMEMEVTVTLEFLEGNRCRQSMETIFIDSRMQVLLALGGASSKDFKEVEVLPYKVEENRLVCGGDSFYIQPDGSLLMPAKSNSQAEIDRLVLQPR